MIRRITVIADLNSPGVLPIFAGLRAYGRRHAVPLSYAPWSSVPFAGRRAGILCVELHRQDARPLLACFDMHDSGSEYLHDRLERCDVYFKRSFDPDSVARLPAALAAKVRPYGLFWLSAEAGDLTVPRRVWCEIRARRRVGAPIGAGDIRWWLLLAGSSALTMLPSRRLRHRLLHREEDLLSGDASLGDTAFFQTRVWDPADTPDERGVAAINDARVAMVTELRRRLGRQFVGGLLRTRFALQRYPDLVTTEREDRPSYLALLKRCRVSVITLGIHRSTPEKTAQSLAAGRCLVSEPLAYTLPVPLHEGTHQLTFRTPRECADHCEQLLEDDELAARMQASNRAYYTAHGSSASTIARCLSATDMIQ